MKNIKYYLILLLAFGCTAELDQANPNQISPSTYYKTPQQALAGVDAIYNGFIIDGAYNRMTPVMNDGRSDEMISRSPWDALTTVSNFNLRATYDVDAFPWNAYYAIVFRANQVLENVPAVTMDSDLKNRILGQAYFLRALAYFNLTSLYDKVPLIISTPKKESDFYPATASNSDLWTQIESDLNTAIPLLPVTYSTVSGLDKDQIGRATKGAALSLLGKALLYNKDYAGAATQFEVVFAQNNYSLATNYSDNFTDKTNIENSNPETIFSIEFTTSTAPGFNWGGDPNATWRQFLAVSPTYGAAGKGFYDMIPSLWLYNEMRTEKTKTGGLDPRFLTTILSYEPTEGYTKAYTQDWAAAGYAPTDFFVKKYTNADLGKTDEFAFTSGINYNILRLADVYLMYAECKNELNDQATAAKYIQKVRDRANLPDREVEFAGYAKSQLFDQLSHERVMEMALEGTRIYDIIRWGWLSDPTKLAMLKSHDVEFDNYAPGKEYLKIPQGELDLNPNLKPNSAN